VRRILTWASWLIMVPVLAFAVTFALNNKSPIELILWPFGLAIELPSYLALFASMIFGVLLGGIFAWMGQGRVRSSLRGQAYEGEVARRELKTEREKAEALEQELKTLKASTTPTAQTNLTVVQETIPPQQNVG